MASCCRTTCSCVITAGNRVTITGNGSSGSPYVINADQTMVQVTDTATVDMTISGSGTAASPYTISSVVKLDSTPPGGGSNLIQQNSEGLYLECAGVRGCFTEGPGIDYNPATGVISAQISSTPGNVTTIGGDGGLYTPSSGQLTVLDTSTVDHTLTGAGTAASPYVLSSTVRLNPTPPGGGSNLLQTSPTGLFIECANVRGCFTEGPGIDYNPATGTISAQISAIPGNTTSIAGDGGIYTPVSGQVTVQDTQTVDMVLTGTGTTASPYVVSANVRLDATPPGGGTNLIGQNADGLFIECANVRGCFTEGPGIDYNPATGTISAQISGQAGNTTSIAGDGGIYTPSSGQVTVTDSATIDHTLTGAGTAASPYVLTSAVRLDATPPAGGTNLIGSGPDGLFVECAGIRTCFTEGNGIDYDPVTGTISARVSTDGGNAVQFGTDGGLWAPVGGGGGGTIVQSTDTASIDTTLTGTGTAGDPYVIHSDVRLDATPPGGGTNLLRLNADGLYIECAQIRTCLTEGPGINYDPVTGTISAQISTDAGNTTSIGTDGGLFTPGGGTFLQALDTATIDTTVTGAGTAGSPYVVSGVVRLDATPPGGGTNLIGQNADGLFIECANVRGCFSAGNGASYNAATGVFSARLSTDAGNQTVFGTDGGIMTPAAAALVTGCGLTGAGTAASPLVVAPEAASRAWSTDWTCAVATNSTLHCDPGTGRLWTPPEHTSAAATVQQNHPLGTPTFGPTGGFVLVDPVNAFAQGLYTADSLSTCRGITFETGFTGHVEVTWTAGSTFDLGYGVSVNGGPAFVRIGAGELNAATPAGHRRVSFDVYQDSVLAAHTGYNVTVYPAISVITGSVTINTWVTDTRLLAVTR